MNIVQLINRQAAVRPDASALIRGSRVIHFRQLAQVIRNLATHLATQGIAPGDRVGLAMGQSVVHMMVILALARLRAVTVPIHTMHAPATRKKIAARFKTSTVICGRAPDGIEGCSQIVIDPSWANKPVEAALPPLVDESAPDADWYVHLSSGSTGAGVPKGVLRTQGDVLTQIMFLTSVFRADPKTRFLCAMDLNVGASLMRALRYLMAGNAVIFPESTGWEGMQAALADADPTHTFISPGLLSHWLRDLGERRIACTALTYVAVGGGRLPRALRQRAVEQLTPNIFSTYGAAETGLTALQRPDDPDLEPVSVGRIVPWAEVQALDDEDQPLPPGKPGRLRFRGHGFATRYYEDPEASAKAFRDGWFYPGDIGRVSRRGALFIEARADDMLNIAGLKVSPGESEGILAAHPAVAEAATFRGATPAGDARLVAAVVLREKIEAKELLKYCRDKLGPRAPQMIVPVSELPRDAMGKVLRGELARTVAKQRKKP